MFAIYHDKARSMRLIAYTLAVDLRKLGIDAVMLPTISSPTFRDSIQIYTPGLSPTRSEMLHPYVEGEPIVNEIEYSRMANAVIFVATDYVAEILRGMGLRIIKARPRLYMPKCPKTTSKRNYACAVFANSPHKDVPMYAKVAKAMPDMKFVFVTGPGYWGEYYDLLKLKNVTIRSNVSSCELERIYSECAVYLAFSHGEGLGIPPLEALVRGIPVVAYDIHAFRETLRGYANFVKVKYVGRQKVVFMKFDRVQADVEEVIKAIRQTYGSKVDVGDDILSWFRENELAQKIYDYI